MADTAEIYNFPERKSEQNQEQHKVAQLEDGYTRIANDLLEAASSHPLTLRQLRVLLAVIRKTYGFNKKADVISGSQLAEITKLSRQKCSTALCDLVALNIIKRSSSRSKVSINTNLSEWMTEPDTGSHNQNGFSEPNSGSECEPETGSLSEPKSGHTKDKKDNIKDNTSSSAKKFTDDDFKVAEFISNRIDGLLPNRKRPNLDKWADQIRIIREQDKRTLHDICKLFDWANRDSFWQANILSPVKLRKQWESLTAKMLASSKSQGGYDASRDTSTDWAIGYSVKVPKS